MTSSPQRRSQLFRYILPVILAVEGKDSILRAILRCAAYELLERKDVPARVVINEYLDVAHAFFEGEEPRVVNGILDAVARDLRSSEFQDKADG